MTRTIWSRRSAGILFAAILVAGTAIRLLGIGWGLPGPSIATEPPFHPDEAVVYASSRSLYSDPSWGHFSWGGALLFRLGHIAHLLSEFRVPDLRARTSRSCIIAVDA